MTTSTTPQSLERRLGPLDAAAIIVANVIGGGILFFPPGIAANVPDTWWFLSTWVAGGVLAFCGAMAYAELAALRPRAGGEYVYLREAYGSLAGFLTGWTSFVAGFAGAMAASAMIIPLYLDRFVPGAASSTPLLRIPLPYVAVTVSNQTIIAIVAVWLFALVHMRGVGPGRFVSNFLTILKVGALLVFIAMGLTMGGTTETTISATAGAVTATGWLQGLIVVMFVYSGWNAAAYMAEEVRNPGRNLPLALALGTAAVTLIYLLINVLYLSVIPIEELMTVKGSVLDVAAERLLGVRAGDIMGIVSLISLAAGINAWTFAGPRIYFAMARDGVFFPQAAHVHPRFKTPWIAVAAQAAWATVLIVTGSLDALGNYVAFAITLFAGVAVAAVFVLRRREPNAARPFKAVGYPVTPAIFVAFSILMVANAIYREPLSSGLGLLVIAAGIPVYWWFSRRRA
ncbi:MAG: amino acid permease [Acidobacteria bacterium]|nr:amino acid permease [Acidobacteriota bacterium]